MQAVHPCKAAQGVVLVVLAADFTTRATQGALRPVLRAS